MEGRGEHVMTARGHPGTQLSCPTGLPGSHPCPRHWSPTSRNLSRKSRAWAGLPLALIMPAPGIVPVLRLSPQKGAEVVSGQPSASPAPRVDYFKKFLFYIEIWLIHSTLLVSGVQQSDSVMYAQVSVILKILFPFRLLYNMEQRIPCTLE